MKTLPWSTCVLLTTLSILSLVCFGPDEKEPAAEGERIAQVIHDSIAWAEIKDKDRLFECLANSPDFFMYNPDSAGTIAGFPAFKEMVERVFMSDSFKATGFEIRELKVNRSASGDAAWFSAVLDDHCEWNGTPASWIDVRWTGVLAKRDGQWVIVQMH